MKKTSTIRRIATIVLLLTFCVADSLAVLKEENLDKTLSILRNELTTQHKEITTRTAMQKRRSEEIRNRIMEVWQKSNQNALMLYSQKQDYVFDLTYACHEATEQYRKFTRVRIPFVSFLNRTKIDIARYDSLTKSLRQMPEKMLSAKANADRKECLRLTISISKTLKENYKNTQDFIRLYNLTAAHLRDINDYANKRYNDIQTDIFKNGSDGYFTILKRFRFVLSQTQQTVEQKYQPRPFINSQWDSKFIFGLFVVIFFYGLATQHCGNKIPAATAHTQERISETSGLFHYGFHHIHLCHNTRHNTCHDKPEFRHHGERPARGIRMAIGCCALLAAAPP